MKCLITVQRHFKGSEGLLLTPYGRLPLFLRVTMKSVLLIVMMNFCVSSVLAGEGADAELNQSVYTYIPAEGASRLLVHGTPAKLITIEGGNAVIALGLKDGSFVETQISLKYLTIFPSKKIQNQIVASSGPNPATASPVEAPPPETAVSTQTSATFTIDNFRVHDTNGDDRGVELDLSVCKDAQSKNLVAKVYYFDATGQLIKAFIQSNSDGWPQIFKADKPQTVSFPLPKDLPPHWSVVAVFGNSKGAVASSVPINQDSNLSYPEHDLVAKTLLEPAVAITDAEEIPTVVEQVVKSDNPAYPAFTLIMHLPHGVKNPRDVAGVLTTCMIANSVQDIRDRLSAIKPENDPNPYFAYAEAHNMAIIAWGSRWVWDSYANFDELDKNQIRNWDANFQSLADAWDRGIQLLVHNYGIPDHDYLMYGLCAGGEWVHRLALHKPDRFLAVQMHISTSYDAPTPEASKVMWLLTTGELDSGADRARRFYSAARGMGYPIIFKAVIGLGHADSPLADHLGISFFDYALSVKAKRDAANANDIRKSQPLDLSGFYASPFYGDLMNQEMFGTQDKDMIPAGFLVPLPTKGIADVWNE